MPKPKKKITARTKYKIVPPSEPQARAAWDEMVARHTEQLRITEGIVQTLEEIRQKPTTLRKQHAGPAGIRFVSTETGNEQAGNRPRFRALKASGQLNGWSRKYSWRIRAAQWDEFLDRHLRSRQLERIERLAEKCLTQVETALDTVMQPIIQAAKAYSDPARVAELEEMPIVDTVRLGLQAALAMPKLQESARLACRVISAPDSPTACKPDQAEWRVSVYAPMRVQPEPEVLGGQGEPLEWEEA